jgi:hypothetical protein
MAYEPYADTAYYRDVFGGYVLPEGMEPKCLRQASRHIDTLTYNRIVGRGISALTPFQQEVVREVCCMQAEFEYENADEIGTILSGYSINGVSAQFGSSWNVFMDKGVAMKKDVYAMLAQTGLCCRLAM